MTEPEAAAESTAPRPRSRPRVTVRAMLLLVVLSALAMLLYVELKDGGLPPRTIVRRLPGRIARLRPGMTRAEAWGVLGLDRPWYRGGVLGPGELKPDGATILGDPVPGAVREDFMIGVRELTAPTPVAPNSTSRTWSATLVARIQLEYRGDHGPGKSDPDGSDRLVGATLTDIQGRRTDMPVPR